MVILLAVIAGKWLLCLWSGLGLFFLLLLLKGKRFGVNTEKWDDFFLTQPFGLNIGTLFPGPLAFRWTFQFYDQSQTSAELADLLERISPYFLNSVQVFGVIIVEAIVFLALIAMVYRRQEI